MKFNLALLAVAGVVAMANCQQQINPECFTRPNNKHPKECCAAPNMMPPREQFASCMQKFPKPEGPPPAPGSQPSGSPPAGFNCMAQCMLEEMGIISNGVLSKDAATSKIVSIVGSSSEWQAVAKSSVDSCYQKVASMASTKDGLGCNSAAGPFMECLPSAMFTDCPSSVWNPSDECKQLKSHLLKGCPFMTLMGHPHH